MQSKEKATSEQILVYFLAVCLRNKHGGEFLSFFVESLSTTEYGKGKWLFIENRGDLGNIFGFACVPIKLLVRELFHYLISFCQEFETLNASLRRYAAPGYTR